MKSILEKISLEKRRIMSEQFWIQAQWDQNIFICLYIYKSYKDLEATQLQNSQQPRLKKKQ